MLGGLNDSIWQLLLYKIAPDQVFPVSIRFSSLVAQLSSIVTWTGKDSTLKSVGPGTNLDLPVTGCDFR